MTRLAAAPTTRWTLALVTVIAVAALAFRVIDLDRKPFHGDEANQAYKAGVLLETGKYRYDPIEHHGPTIYYFMLPFAWLTTHGTFADTTESTYRIVPALFGAAVVLLLIPLRTALGGRAIVFAALLTAVSPAMVYYSRYFIQEMLLVFFAFGAMVAGWKHLQTGSYGSAVAAGVCLGLAHASKETCILAFLSYGGAAACTVAWSRMRDGDFAVAGAVKRIRPKAIVVVAVAALTVSVLLFSSFFTNPRGVLDSILTYANYTNKAGNFRIHDKPWHYYLHMLAYTRHAPYPWFSEALILALGVKGIIATLLAKRSEDRPALNLLRFFAFYTLGMTAAYSVIPYKTPWCALNFLQPLIVMAGVGADALLRGIPWRGFKVAAAAVLAVLTAQLAWQAYLANFVYFADVRNPYVYAHTAGAITRLADRLEGIAAVSPQRYETVVGIVQPESDYWPLPWYLRKFDHVGYWTALPGDANDPLYTAGVIVAAPRVAQELAGRLRGEYHSETHALRPRVLLTVFIRKDLWDAYMSTRQGPSG